MAGSEQRSAGTARITLTRSQAIAIAVFSAFSLAGACLLPSLASFYLMSAQVGFLALAIWRLSLIMVQAEAPR